MGSYMARKPDTTDWRAEKLDRVRAAIMSAAPGIICTGETYRDYLKLTFALGARLEDPAGLFNAGLGGGTRSAIDIREVDKLNEKALRALVKSAVALNTAKAPVKKARAKKK